MKWTERNWSSFDFHGIWLSKNSSVGLIFLLLACRPISMVLRLPKHFLCQSMVARFERASIRNGNYVVGRCYVECRSPIMRNTTKDTCLLKPLLFDFIHEKLVHHAHFYWIINVIPRFDNNTYLMRSLVHNSIRCLL